MPFYDKVKDKIRNNDKEEDEKEESGGGKVAFDQLKEDAEKHNTDEEEPDDTEIEDLSNASGKKYGDPSSIELKDDASAQAGQPAQEETDSDKPERARRREQARKRARQQDQPRQQERSPGTLGPEEAASGQDTGTGDTFSQGTSSQQSSQETPGKKRVRTETQDAQQKKPQRQHRDTGRSAPAQSTQQSADSGQQQGQERQAEQEKESSHDLFPDSSAGEERKEAVHEPASEESRLEVLQDIRRQNEEVIGLLKGIKRSLDR